MVNSLSVAQIGFDKGHIDRHLEKLTRIIHSRRASDLIVFPELILHGHPTVDEPEGLLYRQARVLYGRVSSKLYRSVREAGARVIFGQIGRRVDHLYNIATCADPDVVQHYIKTHVHWTEHFVAGNKLRVFETDMGPIGINICFDAAFPEVWRVLEVLGARLSVNISAVPTGFPVALMHRRMAAAALNNQMYVAYVNRPGPRFSGHSAIFDPRGRKIAEAGSKEQVFTTEIDFGKVEEWRRLEPLAPHRRPKLYRLLTQHQPTAAEPDPGALLDLPEQSAVWS